MKKRRKDINDVLEIFSRKLAKKRQKTEMKKK